MTVLSADGTLLCEDERRAGVLRDPAHPLNGIDFVALDARRSSMRMLDGPASASTISAHRRRARGRRRHRKRGVAASRRGPACASATSAASRPRHPAIRAAASARPGRAEPADRHGHPSVRSASSAIGRRRRHRREQRLDQEVAGPEQRLGDLAGCRRSTQNCDVRRAGDREHSSTLANA
jgi:hypothetical protein